MSRAAEDEETQRRGLVCVIYQIGELSSKFADFEIAREAPKTVHWLPLRISGVHMCVDNPLMKMFARILLAGSGRDFRAKHRLHEGKTTIKCPHFSNNDEREY